MPTGGRLVRIFVDDDAVDVDEGVTLLRCLEQLSGRAITEGDYCWTGECGHCEVLYSPPGGGERAAMACCLAAAPGMRVRALSRYLRLDLGR